MAMTGLNRQQAAKWVSQATRYRVAPANVIYWEAVGLLRRQRPGNRVPAAYRVDDLVRLRLVVELRRDGAPLQRVRKAMAELKRRLPELEHNPTAWRLAVTARGDVVRLENASAVLELTREPGQFMLMDAVAWMAEAREAIAEAAAG